MRMTDYFEDLFIRFALLGGTGLGAKPTGHEVAFWDGDPGELGTGATEVEPFGAGVRLDTITFNDSTARQVANTNAPSNTTTGSGSATYWSIHRSDLSQQMLASAALDSTMNFVSGQPIEIAIGDMVWEFPDTETVWADAVVNDFLSWAFGPSTPTPRTASHVSLHNGVPGSGGLNEFTQPDYARAASAWNTPSAGAGNRTQSTNVSQVDYSNLKAADTPIDWWGVWTAISAGEMIARSDQTNQIINDGDNASAGAGALALLVG